MSSLCFSLLSPPEKKGERRKIDRFSSHRDPQSGGLRRKTGTECGGLKWPVTKKGGGGWIARRQTIPSTFPPRQAKARRRQRTKSRRKLHARLLFVEKCFSHSDFCRLYGRQLFFQKSVSNFKLSLERSNDSSRLSVGKTIPRHHFFEPFSQKFLNESGPFPNGGKRTFRSCMAGKFLSSKPSLNAASAGRRRRGTECVVVFGVAGRGGGGGGMAGPFFTSCWEGPLRPRGREAEAGLGCWVARPPPPLSLFLLPPSPKNRSLSFPRPTFF